MSRPGAKIVQAMNQPINQAILGIESSCDETAAAVVAGGRKILSSVVASQIDIHRKYGGVVPELASREHLRQIVPVVREALEQAGMKLEDVAAIGVTQGPGLVGALLVGLTYGKVLAMALGKPLVPVNHLEGHIHAVFLEAQVKGETPELPAICLIVSGGHTLLYGVRVHEGVGGVDSGNGGDGSTEANGAAHLFNYLRIGGTRDDAAGEAYDKVAKMLALGYPGGPILDQLAPHGNAAAVRFGEVKIRGTAYDFSFSGLKTAVFYYLRNHPELRGEIEARAEALRLGKRKAAELLPLCSAATLDLIASFQRAVVNDLVKRTVNAAEEFKMKSILVSGGVAANSELRAAFERAAGAAGLRAYFPSRALSTDNAAMIAAAAYPRFLAGQFADITLNADSGLKLV